VAAVLVALGRARREHVNPNHIWDMWMWCLIGGFVGARALYIFLFWSQFRDDPVRVFYVWEGGLAFQGGLVGALLLTYVYLKVKRLSVAKYLDIVAAGVILGYGFARVGCFLNGCCHGHTTKVACAVTYPAAAPIDAHDNLRLSPAYSAQVTGSGRPITPEVANDPKYASRIQDGKLIPYPGLMPGRPLASFKEYRARVAAGETLRSLPIHPTQLYAVVSALLIFSILSVYYHLPRHVGQVAALFGILYAVYRFIVECFRGDSPTPYWGLTFFQVVSIGIFIAFGAAWLVCQKRLPKYTPPAPKK